MPQPEADRFHVIVFGDTQPYDLEQLDFLSRDVISEVIGTDAAFGFTLGDLVGDDLSLFEPLNRAIARIGVPWYNVIGNHDMNYDAADDAGSDESFERVYGPSTYAFEYARAHFVVLDDVIYGGADRDPPSRQNYRGGFDADALAFVRAYLAGVPRDDLVVLLMHMPLAGPAPFGFEQGRELLALLADRPNTLSFSAHTHMQYQLLLGPEAGFPGPAPHLHVNQARGRGKLVAGRPGRARHPARHDALRRSERLVDPRDRWPALPPALPRRAAPGLRADEHPCPGDASRRRRPARARCSSTCTRGPRALASRCGSVTRVCGRRSNASSARIRSTWSCSRAKPSSARSSVDRCRPPRLRCTCGAARCPRIRRLARYTLEVRSSDVFGQRLQRAPADPDRVSEASRRFSSTTSP